MPDSDSSTVGAPSRTDTALPASAAPLQAPQPPRPDFRLKAPLRLNPAVRDALAAIVHTLNGPGSAAAACAVADGLFVPLHELEQRGIQPALAARALAEVRLLVHKDHKRPPTVSRDFAGAPTVGLFICPSCVEGFDPATFTVAAPAEH